MIDKFLVGSFGSTDYSVSGRDITLLNLPESISLSQIAYILNVTKGVIYYATTPTYKDFVSLSGDVITIADSFALMDGADDLHIQIFSDPVSFDGIASSPYTHSSARGDFTAAFKTNVTLDIAGTPKTVDNSKLAQIVVTNAAGIVVRRYINGVNGVAMSITSDVITITGAGTPFATGDKYDVQLNLFDKSKDISSNADLVSEISPPWSRYTALEDYTTLTPVDVAYDEGAVINVEGFNFLNYAFSKTASDADNSYIKIVYLDASGGTVDYQETYLGTPTTGVTAITPNLYEVDKAALVNIATFPTKGFPYMRIDIAKKTDTGTDAAFTGQINKSYL